MKTVACFQFSRWAAFGIGLAPLISMQIKWGYYVSVCRKKENRESKLSRLNFTFLPAIGEKREAGTFHKRSAETSRCIFKAEGAPALKNRSWHSHAAGRGVLRSTESFSARHFKWRVWWRHAVVVGKRIWCSDRAKQHAQDERLHRALSRWRVQSTITAG